MTLKVMVGLVSIVAAPRAAWAQGQAIDGIIEGVVRAQATGQPLAGASVRAFNAGTGYERSVVSDAAGRYGMPLMPPGEYVVFVEAPTFASMSQTGAILRAGATLTVEFTLPAASFSETVQVTADQPAVESGARCRATPTKSARCARSPRWAAAFSTSSCCSRA